MLIPRGFFRKPQRSYNKKNLFSIIRSPKLKKRAQVNLNYFPIAYLNNGWNAYMPITYNKKTKTYNVNSPYNNMKKNGKSVFFVFANTNSVGNNNHMDMWTINSKTGNRRYIKNNFNNYFGKRLGINENVYIWNGRKKEHHINNYLRRTGINVY
jgi:hypothetical protein